jgi:hypothetical protein
VSSLLVEIYLPRSRAHDVRSMARRARAAAEAMARETGCCGRVGLPVAFRS